MPQSWVVPFCGTPTRDDGDDATSHVTKSRSLSHHSLAFCVACIFEFDHGMYSIMVLLTSHISATVFLLTRQSFKICFAAPASSFWLLMYTIYDNQLACVRSAPSPGKVS